MQLIGVGAEELGERRCVGVGVEEDEAGEGVDRHLEQPELGLVEVADEVRAGDAAQVALEVVGPEVVRAHEAGAGVARRRPGTARCRGAGRR